MFLIKRCLWQFFPPATKKMERILFQTVCLLFLNAVWLCSCCLLLGKYSRKWVHTMCVFRRRFLLGGAKNSSLILGQYKWWTSLQDFGGVFSGTCVLLGYISQHDPQGPVGLRPRCPSPAVQTPFPHGALTYWQLSPIFDLRQLKGLAHQQKAEGKVSGLLKYGQIVRLLGGLSPGNRFKTLDYWVLWAPSNHFMKRQRQKAAHKLSAVNYLLSYNDDKPISSDSCIYVAKFLKK